MKVRDILKEEWDERSYSAFINGKKTIINIYKNPTSSEMNAVAKNEAGLKTLKFIVKGKDLYVFSPKVYHLNIIRELGFNRLKDYPQGVAIFEDGEWKAVKDDHMYDSLKSVKLKRIKI